MYSQIRFVRRYENKRELTKTHGKFESIVIVKIKFRSKNN